MVLTLISSLCLSVSAPPLCPSSSSSSPLLLLFLLLPSASPVFGLQRSSGSELQEIMRRRQEKLAASTCDSGVESFDEGTAH